MLPRTKDLDYLAGRLHARRSRLAEGARLDMLCQLRTSSELFRNIHPDSQLSTVADFQRALVQDLVAELADMLANLTGPGRNLVEWMSMWFDIENLKVLVRGILTRMPKEQLRQFLVVLHPASELNLAEALKAESLATFINLLPDGLRQSAKKAFEHYGTSINPFLFEAALDRSYFQELLRRTSRIRGVDKALIGAIVRQETDLFHIMLVTRGKFFHGLAPDLLMQFHVSGTSIPAPLFAAMLKDPDLLTAATRVLGRVVNSLPPALGQKSWMTIDPAALETLAWNRFLRLANQAFRRSHIGLGAVIGYIGLRRIETTNLITVSEGIRIGVPAEQLHARMLPRNSFEPVHV